MTPVNDDMANAVLGYKSPIELYMNEIKTKIDGDCVKAVQEYGFKVDKNELAKALKYDRDQYNSGYLDGYMEARRKFERPHGVWGKWVITEIRCPNCLEYFQTDCYSTEELKECPSCGADMKGGAT